MTALGLARLSRVPAVAMILKVWKGIPEGTLVGLARLSSFAGNLFLVGSLANSKVCVLITLLSLRAGGLWLRAAGLKVI